MNRNPPCGIGLLQGGLIMNGMYDVYLGDKSVGNALVERQGLYYRIRVRCDMNGEGMFQVFLHCGNHRENLGVLVPVDDRFGLETRIPAKRIGEGDPVFRVMPRHGRISGKYIPISPEEPFRYLSRLKDSYLERRNGSIGIVIKGPGHEKS